MKTIVSISGGTKFYQRLKEIEEKMKSRGVYIGLPKGTGNYEDGTPIAVIGAVQEFGSANGQIPERSFLRVPLRAAKKEFSKIIQNLLPKILSGEITQDNALHQLGAKAVSVSQEAISAGIDPPNAPSTVKRKGSSTPLINEGTLRQNITHVIGDEDES